MLMKSHSNEVNDKGKCIRRYKSNNKKSFLRNYFVKIS